MTDPREHLPLTPHVFQVLVAISDGPLHGYAIIQEVARLTDGVIVMRTGTLYLLLQRLLDHGFIVESRHREKREDDDERRRYYELTPLGRAVLRAEAKRLERAVAVVRRKGLLSRLRP